MWIFFFSEILEFLANTPENNWYCEANSQKRQGRRFYDMAGKETSAKTFRRVTRLQSRAKSRRLRVQKQSKTKQLDFSSLLDLTILFKESAKVVFF